MFQNNLLMAAASTAAGAYTVDDSVRYNDDDSPYLYRTPTTVGNRLTGTISLWYKRCNLGSIQQLYNSGSGNDIGFNASDKLIFLDTDSGASYITTQVFRDPSAWGHLVFAWDTTDTTAGDRIRIYHNGTEITDFDTETNPNINWGMGISNNVRQTVGANEGNTEEFDGYLSQFYYVDGQQLTPSSFGESDDNGVWRPIEFAGGGTGYSGSLVPVMTDYDAPSGEVTFSSEYSSYWKAWYAFNNSWDNSNAWIPTLNTMGWLAYEFDSAKIITRYIFGCAQFWDAAGARDFTFEGWDGDEWIVLDTQTGISWTSAGDERKLFTFSNTTSYIKYRLDITEDNGATNTGTNELMMIGSSSGYGENGFFLDFADSSDFGNDVSGNNNDYTSSGLAANDQVSDTPTDNFCTLNSLAKHLSTLANGNLDVTAFSGTYDDTVAGTMFPSSGKWYWEQEASGVVADFPRAGIMPKTSLSLISGPTSASIGMGGTSLPDSIGWVANGPVNQNGSTLDTYNTYTNGDVIGVALDLDNGKLYFSKNGTFENSSDPAAGTNPVKTGLTGSWGPCVGGFSSRLFKNLNFGQRAFDGTAPTGFKALNTSNLAAPSIPDGTAHFQPTLYTGDGSVRNIDQTGNSTFQPDTVWIKNRSAADGASIFDSNRGATKYWGQSTTAIEVTNANSLTSFDSDGFGLGSGAGGWNDNTENFVAWQWLAGGAGSSNTDGSINTDKTSVNTTAGMSIGLYTGNATVNATVGHGLGVKPDMFIVKNMDSAEQIVMYIGYLGAHYGTYLGATAAPYDLSIYWNDVEPTSTVINLDDFGSVNGSGHELILWAFVSVDGFSKFGSYTGNGDADGTYVYTGFKPAMILIGKTSSTRTLWPMYDSARSPYNEIDDQLAAINSAAETTGSEEVDFLSNGFKIRTADSDVNTSAATYFFAAWAEYPFGGDGVTPATAF